MELSRNNDAVVVAHHSSDPEDGQAVFDNLPIHDDYGNEITYVLTTTTLQHYDAQITRTDTGFHINFVYLNDHNWETTRTEPTCTVDGSIVSVCKDCGATDRVVLPATGHKLVSSGHDATCTQDGYQRYMCTQCDYWYEKRPRRSATTGATGRSILRPPLAPTASSTALACAAVRWRRMPFRATTTSTPR